MPRWWFVSNNNLNKGILLKSGAAPAAVSTLRICKMSLVRKHSDWEGAEDKRYEPEDLPSKKIQSFRGAGQWVQRISVLSCFFRTPCFAELMMRCKSHIALLFSLLMWGKTSAQKVADTVWLPEAIKYAGKTEKQGSIQSLNPDSLELPFLHHTTVADWLINNGEVNVTQYGNSLSSLSIYGLGSNHTRLNWNGLSVPASPTGVLDLSLFPVAANTTLLTGTGGGQNSIGGTINLKAYALLTESQKAMLSIEGGSFHTGSLKAELLLKSRSEKLLEKSLFSMNDSRGDFNFINSTKFNSPLETISNNAHTKMDFIEQIEYWKSEKTKIDAVGWWQKSKIEIPPQMFASFSNENRTDSALRVQTGVTHYGETFRFETRLGYNNENLHYINPKSHIDSKSKIVNMSGYSKLSINTINGIKCNLLLDGQESKVSSTGFLEKHKESQFGLSSQVDYHLKLINLSVNLREDIWNKKLSLPIYNFSLNSSDTTHVVLNFNIGKATSHPTLNDRYWYLGGNPNLKDELAKETEAGLTFYPLIKKERLLISCKTFLIRADNFILWQPSSFGYWIPENIRKVRSSGILSKVKYANKWVGMEGGYSLTKAINTMGLDSNPSASSGKQLVYTPLHKAHLSVGMKLGKNNVLWNTTYTGKQYTSTDNSEYLFSYLLCNIGLERQFLHNHTTYDLYFKLNNIFNKQYQSVAAWAMPGRNLLAGITININK